MPDSRRHRGQHPADATLFAEAHVATLGRAVSELSWLLSRGYTETASLKLVGDRHALTARQRVAVMRCACTDTQRDHRLGARVPSEALAGRELVVDGFNILITLESALSGGLLLRSRDAVWRDLASVHGTYRAVEETDRALVLLGEFLASRDVANVRWLLDRPVSNSGRLRARMMDLAEERGWPWIVELHDNPDRPLRVERAALVATADGWILDGDVQWVDLVTPLLETIPSAWRLEFMGC